MRPVGKAAAPVTVRRRRTFGLDAARPSDTRRTEAAVLAWLAARMPRVLPLRVALVQEGSETIGDAARPRLLALTPPGGRLALLRIEARPGSPAAETRAFADLCTRRRIPLAIISHLDEARQALRRLGIESEEV